MTKVFPGVYRVKLYAILQCLSEDYEGIDDGRHYTLSYEYTDKVVVEEDVDGSLEIWLFRNTLPLILHCKYAKRSYCTNQSVVEGILKKCRKYGIECEYKLVTDKEE